MHSFVIFLVHQQQQQIMPSTPLVFVIFWLVCACKAFDADEDVLFKLYKRDNPKRFTILNVNRSRIVSDDKFDPELPTRIHIHGFLPKDEIIDRYRDLYLSNGDYNFIVVDWSEGTPNSWMHTTH